MNDDEQRLERLQRKRERDRIYCQQRRSDPVFRQKELDRRKELYQEARRKDLLAELGSQEGGSRKRKRKDDVMSYYSILEEVERLKRENEALSSSIRVQEALYQSLKVRCDQAEQMIKDIGEKSSELLAKEKKNSEDALARQKQSSSKLFAKEKKIFEDALAK
eukprot:TRINITY_DN3938_c0_g1_i1.p1 TRINITY_DN3938_c0_g1~~TRINITY_DN3938_c0_g1_i1.p1  ORF type:complete len:163 (-),score=12.62 TRINITY_DN3938_c0_g1_i1:102-590(-)